jgi:dTDP-4-dehydrorhamnose reductase
VKWLITGAGGMLGHDLAAVLARRDAGPVTLATRADLDITDPAQAGAAVAGHDVVINAAAWTDVDGAETAEAAATRVNGTGPANLATACLASGARLIQISTDYVFAGNATSPYAEDAPTDPVNAYGRGKLAGEEAVLGTLPETGYVVRTAWLYGAHGRNFVATMLKLAQTRDFVEVVDDQRGQPTWTDALAGQLISLGQAAVAGQAPAGVYHGTGTGIVTWRGLAQEAYALAGLDPQRVRATDSAAFARPAPRPAYSVLGHDRWARAGLSPMAPWQEQLKAAMPSLMAQVG